MADVNGNYQAKLTKVDTTQAKTNLSNVNQAIDNWGNSTYQNFQKRDSKDSVEL